MQQTTPGLPEREGPDGTLPINGAVQTAGTDRQGVTLPDREALNPRAGCDAAQWRWRWRWRQRPTEKGQASRKVGGATARRRDDHLTGAANGKRNGRGRRGWEGHVHTRRCWPAQAEIKTYKYRYRVEHAVFSCAILILVLCLPLLPFLWS